MTAFYVGYNRFAMRTDASLLKKRLRPALAAGVWLLCSLAAPAIPAHCAEPQPGAASIEELWTRGETAFKAGDLDKALLLFNMALTSDMRRARSWNYVGGVHFAQGDLPRALAEFRSAMELDPRDVRVCNNLGTTLERLGDYAGAEAAYAQAVLIDPSYPITQRNLGILQSRRLGNPEAARRSWQRYLELSPTGADADEIRRELATLGAAPSTPAPAPAPAPPPAPVPAPTPTPTPTPTSPAR